MNFDGKTDVLDDLMFMEMMDADDSNKEDENDDDDNKW